MRALKRAYVGDRADLVDLVPRACRRVLDLGCAEGDLGATIKPRQRNTVLEHLIDPWTVLSRALGHLLPTGYVVASIPNVGHLDTIANLLVRKRWPYRSRGVHDQTHIRQFALENVRSLFDRRGLFIERLERAYRIVERPHRLNRFARRLAVPYLSRELLTYQFLVVARRKP